MRKRYDFSKAKRNPYARRLKQQVTIRLDRDTIKRKVPHGKQAMWRPTELGDIVAERELKLRRKGRRASVVRVRFGRPIKAPNAGRQDPWWCPVLITGLGKPRTTSIAGEDSLQALVLALQYVVRLLPLEAKRAGGTFAWLAETERPVFGGTALLEFYSETINVLFEEIKAAVRKLEGANESKKISRGVAKRLMQVVERTGFRRNPHPRR